MVKMGASVTSIVVPWGNHKKTLNELQQIILQYLDSDNYSADPHEHFNDVAGYGYSSMEEFISEIPSNVITELILSRGIEACPAAKIGMRYVHTNEPWKRGKLVKVTVLPTKNIATLQLDTSEMPRKNIFQKVFAVMSYFMFPPLFLLQLYRRYNYLTEEAGWLECNFDELQVEKEHLLAYLKQKVYHNHLIPVNLHDIEKKLPLTPPHTRVQNHNEPNYEAGLIALNLSPVPFPATPVLAKEFIQTKKKGKQRKGDKLPREKVCMPKKEDMPATNAVTEVVKEVDISKRVKESVKIGPVGTHKGIEGANNSCYMDAMLFTMFYTTTIFDYLLEPKSADTKFMRKTRRILRESVVIPLRENYFCDYESLMILRKHLSRLNQDLMGAFMDAEQILYLLCDEVLKERNFIQYAGVDEEGWGDYMHLMNIDATDISKVITVQRNLETSFAFNGDIRMACVPSPALILGMPRSNRELIHYEAVIPNPEINIENLLEYAGCRLCHVKATWEAQNNQEENSDALAFCDGCIASVYEDMALNCSNKRIVSRQRMQLSAIVCIRGVHFVAFVRTSGSYRSYGNSINNGNHHTTNDSAWYFFDSMAGGSSEVQVVPKMEIWLNKVATNPEQFYTSKKIPALVKRSFTDGHLCIYEPVY